MNNYKGMTMSGRERFLATMRREKVDRLPFDLAGTSLTGIDHPESVTALARRLGFDSPWTGNYEKFDERILERLGIDFRRVGDILSPKGGLEKRISETENVDCWGVKRRWTGLYWDIVDPPLRGASIADLDAYPWPRARDVDPALIDRFARTARRLFEETDYAVCGEHPVYGVFELGCWMCGFDDFMLRMALEPEFVRRFFDIVLEYQREVIALYYGAIGGYIQVTTSGDDFGTQTGPFISPEMFRDLIKPYYAERIACTRRFTGAFYFHHTCGSVHALLPDLIDAGVDILNPIQPGARDMEPDRLKRDFGDRLVFWGGIDTQNVLPRGTTAEVERTVRSVLDAMGGAGYILAPAHNLQPDVPPENIAAIFEAGSRYFRT
jgi:uroporphyrinogen decarboxylase